MHLEERRPASQEEQDRKRALLERRERIHESAKIDGLTGLLNRQAFAATMATFLGALAESRRSGDPKERRAAILMCDVDHFKHVNDTYGHPAGDEVLKRV